MNSGTTSLLAAITLFILFCPRCTTREDFSETIHSAKEEANVFAKWNSGKGGMVQVRFLSATGENIYPSESHWESKVARIEIGYSDKPKVREHRVIDTSNLFILVRE